MFRFFKLFCYLNIFQATNNLKQKYEPLLFYLLLFKEALKDDVNSEMQA